MSVQTVVTTETMPRLAVDLLKRHQRLTMPAARMRVADAGGNLIVVGETRSRFPPLRGARDGSLDADESAGIVVKFNAGLTDVTMATVMNGFHPAAILPHPEGGYWIVGHGREDVASYEFDDVMLVRMKSSPAELPRVDSLEPAERLFRLLRAGDRAVVRGEGFTGDTVVYFDDVAVAPRNVTGTRMEVEIPAGLRGGIYGLRVETGTRKSGVVRVRVLGG